MEAGLSVVPCRVVDMNKREFSNADIPLLKQDAARAERRLRKGYRKPATGWAAHIIPDPFENKRLVSENTPSPF